MRLNKKCKILELIKTIEDGIDYAKNKGAIEAIAILNDCIEALTYISNTFKDENNVNEIIKKIISEITVTFDLINNNELLEKSIDLIKKMINNLKDKIINEIDTQLEIAFMPYKASMWDCMESVWKEANDDPNCSCYVVPIPYYELDKRGEVSKICYEEKEFSKNIEITPYNLYDLENREPDIIYIHNPYDDCNRLTMVDPRYFSKNLSKFTNMLVYIPYFVAGSYQNITTHKNLSLLPGPLNATKIIVQSKTQKEAFISNGYSPNKILDLGSPKFDATLLTLKKDYDIDLHWKDIIKDKKVVLFSTGITNLLSDTNWINDLNQVLDVFINNPNCILIWRPHPLTDVTINTMRPNLLEVFVEIKDKIAMSQNIIIDANTDVYSTMSISDALISDYSSVMFQYMATGKPILGILEEHLLEPDRIYAIDYLANYFKHQTIDIIDFRNMVLEGQDTKKEERMNRLRKSITNVEGTCGQKIHETIKCEVSNSLLNYLTKG